MCASWGNAFDAAVTATIVGMVREPGTAGCGADAVSKGGLGEIGLDSSGLLGYSPGGSVFDQSGSPPTADGRRSGGGAVGDR